tara:strand:+ start:264 stop:680 length:417 start_codon:yes stop_codon:yes gene_type:complete
MNLKNILYLIFIILLSSCQKEICLDCRTYDFYFPGNLEDFHETFYVCENDAMWDEIAWANECPNCTLPINEGGAGALIDLEIYTVGWRHVDNVDIDGDGIHNEIDYDIDGDDIFNIHDDTPYGLENNIIVELIICTED